MADYATAVGFIQFPVEERELPSKDVVRDVSIRTPGLDAPLIRITVWPEFADTELNEGDFIAVDGEYTERIATKNDRPVTYRNMSAKRIAVVAQAEKPEREVVNKKASKGSF